ncbi:MAG: hypothetical protein LBR50_01175 [Tannerella sp.]|jgi:hypothetical protein|nr:hypothetical protein [Tannerella sp.]
MKTNEVMRLVYGDNHRATEVVLFGKLGQNEVFEPHIMIKSPLRYPDSKSLAAETIAMLLPDFDEFREFFLGYKLAFVDMRAIKTSFPPHSNNKTTSVVGKLAFAVTRAIKTSFSPHSNNKTTSVAKRYTPYNNLITSLKNSTT